MIYIYEVLDFDCGQENSYTEVCHVFLSHSILTYSIIVTLKLGMIPAS